MLFNQQLVAVLPDTAVLDRLLIPQEGVDDLPIITEVAKEVILHYSAIAQRFHR